MKNKLMLIALALALIVALTACGKIEPTEADYRDEIKAQALELLEMPNDTECELFLIETQYIEDWEILTWTWVPPSTMIPIFGNKNVGENNTYILVFGADDEPKGYKIYTIWYYYDELTVQLGEQVEISIGTSNDLWGIEQ